jgi:hypothetical protein
MSFSASTLGHAGSLLLRGAAGSESVAALGRSGLLLVLPAVGAPRLLIGAYPLLVSWRGSRA